jgi:hypothetical protein
MIIGNVVTSKIKDIKIPYLNVVGDISEIDNEYPTLLVGYYDLKGKYELDFIERKIEDNLFWTFLKTEERTLFNRDLYQFIQHCEKEFLSDFNYYYLDPFKIKIRSLKKLIHYVKSNPSHYFIEGEMLFIHTNGVTLGIHLGVCGIIGIPTNEVHLKLTKYNIKKISVKRIERLRKLCLDMDYDDAQLLYISEKIG